jgi:hypothetical protein
MTLRYGTIRCGAVFDSSTNDKGITHLIDLPYALCTFVLSTSAQRELVKDFQKPPRPHVFYMPL